MKIVACMCVRNEEYYLPGFFDHIRKYVDAFCILDDGSVDGTLDLISAEPKVEKLIASPPREGIGYDERGNRETIVRASREIGADWVLCCDPDERFETRFLKRMRHMAEELDDKAYSLHFRELWGGVKTYRDDGIWGRKTKFIFFPLSDEMTFDFKHQYHTYWHYKELEQEMTPLDFNLYHLKMIKEEERIKRVELYNKLDPDLEIQPIGYDYLIDEQDIHLSKIKFINRYDYSTLPPDLRAMK